MAGVLASLAHWVRAGFEVFTEEALELGDRDQPLTPGRLDRVHGGNEAAVDRRDADAERLGCLLAAVGEPLGLDDLLQLAGRRLDELRLGTVVAESLSLSPLLPLGGHVRLTVMPASDSTCGASVSGLPGVVLFVHAGRLQGGW